MPRTARASRAGICYHVMNRGNARATVFFDEEDYLRFLDLLRRAKERLPTRVLAYCLMPNHFHLVIRPFQDGDLGVWMQWLLTSHVRWHQRRHRTTGRIWQGRFKAFPIQSDVHLLTVMRYVERNPLRAGLVDKAAAWPWSSLDTRGRDLEGGLLSASPVPIEGRWEEWVEEPLSGAELERVRESARLERPFGDPAWVRGTAERLGLLRNLRPRGRPKGTGNESIWRS